MEYRYGKQLVNNAIWGQSPIVMQLVSGLVVMPLMISYFGDRYYGLWVLAGTLLGYFGLLDFGFSKAIVRYVSSAIGQNDKEKSDGWISLGIFLLLLSSTLGLILIIPVVWGLQFFVEDELSLFRRIFIIVGVTFLIELPSKGFAGVLQAHIRGDILDRILASISFIRILAFLFALHFTLSFIQFFYILSVSTIIQSVIIIFFALKVHGGFKFERSFISKPNIKLFIDFSGFSFIGEIADIFRFKAYPFIVVYFLGLSHITIFQIANRLRLILGAIHNKVLINLTSVYSQIEGRGDPLQQAYLFSYKLSNYFVGFTVGLTAIVAQPFIHIWMGEEYQQSVTILLIALIGGLAAGIQSPTVSFLFGTSKHRFYAISNTLEAFLIIAFAVVLVSEYGLIGMVSGASAATFFVKIFIQPLWVIKDFGLSLDKFHVKYTLLFLFRVAIFLAGIYFLSFFLLRPDYLAIFLFCLGTAILFFLYIWWVGFTKNERVTLFYSLPFLKRHKILNKFFLL